MESVLNQNRLQIWFFRVVLIASSGAFLLAIVAAPGHRWGLWGIDFVYASLFKVLVGSSIAALLTGFPVVVLGFLGGSRRVASLGSVAVLVAVVAGVWPTVMLIEDSRFPNIHEVSTDTRDPPRFVAILSIRQHGQNPPVAGGSLAARLQQQYYPDLKTIRLRESQRFVFDAALAVIGDLDWQLVATNRQHGRIEATRQSPWFGLHFDLVIRIRDDGSVTRVDVRSQSRNGNNDLGQNAAQVRAFRHALKLQLTTDSA